MIGARTVFLMTAATVALLVPSAALAQDSVSAPEPAADAAPPVADDEAIVITAQKRPQVAIDVPQSISVIGGETLEKQQATNFQDYLKLVPGLQLTQSNPGEGRLILRGLNTGGVASTVAVYVDETPFGSSTGLVNGGVLAGDFDTFDVNRIEVLRGPQGTLYGANSLGGLLKFVTNAPDTTRMIARARVSLEDTKGGDMSYRGQAVINVPLSDTVALRASGTYRKEGGFIDSRGLVVDDNIGVGTLTTDDDDNINSMKSYGGRISLLFKPTDAFDIRLSASMQNIRAKAPTVVESDPDTLESLRGMTQSQFVPAFGNLDYRVYNALINYDFGFATLTSSTSLSRQNQTKRVDVTYNLSPFIELLSGTPNEMYLGQDTNSKKFTQELRLASHESDRFEWMIGGYYTHEKGHIFQEYVTVEPGTLIPVTTAFGLLAEVFLDSDYKEYAGFANATWHISDRVHLDFGGRYSHNKQKAAQVAAGALAGGVPINTDLKSSDNVFTYSVAPRFEINDHTSIYARVAKGYRPGGPNAVPPNPPPGTPPSFDPDTTTSYELGIKGENADRRFSFDAAVYHIDWSDIQLLTVINDFGVNANGGSADVDGAELTATYRPLQGLNLSANLAYTNARLADDAPALVGGLKGDKLPWTPKLSLGLNADYSWALSGSAEAYLGASLRALSRQTADYDGDFVAANGHQRRVSAYEVFDLRGGVDFGKVAIDLYVKNLFNSHGRTSTVGPTANGLSLYPDGAIGTGVIRPRVIGISLTAGM